MDDSGTLHMLLAPARVIFVCCEGIVAINEMNAPVPRVQHHSGDVATRLAQLRSCTAVA